jgi:hypothetical protein
LQESNSPYPPESEVLYVPEREHEGRTCLKQAILITWNALAAVAIIVAAFLAFRAISGEAEPTPTPTPVPGPTVVPGRVLLEAVQHVNKQIFVEHYNAVDVHYNEAPSEWAEAIGIRQEFVVLVRGRVPAGFDLREIGPDSIWVSPDGQRVQLTLPPPIVLEEQVAIDLDNSYVLVNRDRCPSFLCRDNIEAYQDEILNEGKTYLIEYALQNGILDQAARDGQAYYEQFLSAYGFEEVRVLVTGYD